MVEVRRYKHNPILKPDKSNEWESVATFNGCVLKEKDKFHMLYRAISENKPYRGGRINLSTIGYAFGTDGVNFGERRLLTEPEHSWEMFGCEDPRVVKIGGEYFIFYTGISTSPPVAAGIKVCMAVTKDFKNIEKHPVTFFNSKAMSLFPKKIDGKYAGILTAHTDIPPSKICLAFFDKKEQMWSEDYWRDWYSNIDEHEIDVPKGESDHLEIGAPPVKTDKGWIVVYSHIKNYLSPPRIFQINALLLDLENPSKIIGKTKDALLVPEKKYELVGDVPNVIFPSGAIVQKEKLYIYYGAADTTCCLAMCDLENLLDEMLKH